MSKDTLSLLAHAIEGRLEIALSMHERRAVVCPYALLARTANDTPLVAVMDKETAVFAQIPVSEIERIVFTGRTFNPNLTSIYGIAFTATPST